MRNSNNRGVVYGMWSRKLARVLGYIEENLSGPLGYDVLCQIGALSRSRFGLAFRESMGMTPHRYIVMRRVEKAKFLLIETEMPVAEVAISVGFSSQSHLSSCFRSLTGTTPSHYRRHGCPGHSDGESKMR